MATRYYYSNPYEPRSDLIERRKVNPLPTAFYYGSCELVTDLSDSELEQFGYTRCDESDGGHFEKMPYHSVQ